MKNKKHTEPTDGVLTNRMDTDTKEFNEFQALLLNKSRYRSEKQKKQIELTALRFKMEDYLRSEEEVFKPAGGFLKSYLKVLQIQQNRFADYIGLRPSNLSKLINGERPINYELALILGKIFNLDPLLWLDIQAKNELRRLTRSKQKDYFKYSLEDLMNE